tara:strand:- start:47 stop:499 length:453 start_codon:yes stop_codon:yes gene_type:complete
MRDLDIAKQKIEAPTRKEDPKDKSMIETIGKALSDKPLIAASPNVKGSYMHSKEDPPMGGGQMLEELTVTPKKTQQPDWQTSGFNPNISVTKESASTAKGAYETGFTKAKKDNPKLTQSQFNTGVGKNLAEQVNVHTINYDRPMQKGAFK